MHPDISERSSQPEATLRSSACGQPAARVVVQVAGAPIGLRLADADFRKVVLDHYSWFAGCGTDRDPLIELTIEIAPQAFPKATPGIEMPERVPVVRWERGAWRFRRYDFQVEYWPEAAKGSVQLSEASITPLDSVLRVLHSIIAVTKGGCLFHAASAVRNGRAFLFSGSSGAGKTTISSLIPPDAALLTDEISYVAPRDGRFEAFGTPFAGTLGIFGADISAPLAAIYLLAKGPTNETKQLPPVQAAAALLRNVLFFAEDPNLVKQVFETICRLVAQVPVYQLTFFPTPAVWELIV